MEKIVYGSEIAAKIRQNISEEIDLLKKKGKRIPHLVVLLVGENVGSVSYVRGKEKACIEVGMKNTTLRYPETITQEELLTEINRLNHDEDVDGILVQMPLPSHINEHEVLLAIDPNKDVDGFHPMNIGKMMIQEETFLPCTPQGIIRILEEIGYDDLSGLNAVVVGRSNIVGKPVAQLLMNKNATVTVVHSRTKNIENICNKADILVVAIGKAKHVTKEWVKEGAVVIDVGVNRNEFNKLCGDVDFDDVFDKVKHITPVPKGVGPMTIAMLLSNTLYSCKRKHK